MHKYQHPGFYFQADLEAATGGPALQTAGTASAAAAAITPPAQTSDYEARYRGLMSTYEKQRQEMEALKGQLAGVDEIKSLMAKMAQQMDSLAATNAQLDAQRKQAEAEALQGKLETRKRDLLAKQNPTLVAMAAYIPVVEDEAGQVQAVADFVAAMNGIAQAQPPTPPTSSPPASIQAPARSVIEIQGDWIDAIMHNDRERSAKLEAEFNAVFAASPTAAKWDFDTVKARGVSAALPV